MRRYDPFGYFARLTDDEIDDLLEKRALARQLREDGHTQEEIARRLEVSLSSVRALCPGEISYRVPVAPLREAFLASPMTAGQLGKALGWERFQGGGWYGDSARVKRTLGILPTRSRGSVAYRQVVDAETVALMADAIGISPWSVLPDEEPAAIPSGAPVMVAA